MHVDPTDDDPQDAAMALEILKDLFFIQRGYLNANHFALKGPAPVLIDTAYVGGIDQTRELLVGLGIGFSDVRRIVNTHCHCDHVGGNRIIQEASGCGVAMHPIGRHFIHTKDDWATWWRYYDQDADFFKCTQSLEDGEVVSIGPHEFRVIHTPGHSADGMVLYHLEDKILISSDALWEADVPVMTLRVEGSRALFSALESLDCLAALDVRMVYPGHGGPFADVAGAIARARAKIKGYLDDRRRIGTDQIKKIMIYTLLMRASMPEDRFFGRLMDTIWFRETVDLYFAGAYRKKYEEILSGFMARGIVVSTNGFLSAAVAA